MKTIAPPFQVALILGGARSGKSRYALGLAGRCPAPRLFVATCEPRDAEMEARIEAHQRERGSDWTTREVPLDLPGALTTAPRDHGVILVDCLTMWVSNLLAGKEASPGAIQTAGEKLVEVAAASAIPVILVSNEVGWGIVPDNPLAREFRDQAGWLHQRLARVADLVVLMAAGLPLVVKAENSGPGRP
jgi:adenosylcobinamide kinase/adenosylcobinamide-phosphate guanylyltransferase